MGGYRLADPTPAIESASVVLVGSFNPAILQPRWLADQNLIRLEEATQAEDTKDGFVISPELTVVRLSWLEIQVAADRFVATTTDSSQFRTLREFVTGLFELLEHTPVTAMGLNRHLHIELPATTTWQAIEGAFAPRTSLRSVFQGKEETDIPFLMTLAVRGWRAGSSAEHLNVKIEPSKRIQEGLYLETNEHYTFAKNARASAAMDILREDWDSAQGYALPLAARIIEACK